MALLQVSLTLLNVRMMYAVVCNHVQPTFSYMYNVCSLLPSLLLLAVWKSGREPGINFIMWATMRVHVQCTMESHCVVISAQ